MAKVGRNAPCPCGSGKKYKRCHGNPSNEKIAVEPVIPPPQMKAMLEQLKAKELTRTKQQGLGKPIISTDMGEHKMVAVGNTVHFSKNWKFFPDFLSDYLKKTVGGDWGNAEIAKAFEDRHPLVQWYQAYCDFQKNHKKQPDGTYQAEPTGVVYCYVPPDLSDDPWLTPPEPDFSDVHNGFQYETVSLRREFYGHQKIKLPDGGWAEIKP